MATAMVTTNITLPKSDWKAVKIVAMEQGVSMAEFIRRVVEKSVKRDAEKLIRKCRLTVNGFTPEFEEAVLEAAQEPIDETKVLGSIDDIDKFFDRMLRNNAWQKSSSLENIGRYFGR